MSLVCLKNGSWALAKHLHAQEFAVATVEGALCSRHDGERRQSGSGRWEDTGLVPSRQADRATISEALSLCSSLPSFCDRPEKRQVEEDTGTGQAIDDSCLLMLFNKIS